MIKVLVVEDSPVIREFLAHILGSDPALEVVGTAADGLEALEAVKSCRPDVITMDINMPRMDGFEATRQIMETCPTPIVIVSGSSRIKEVAFSFRAMEAGALSIISRPEGIDSEEFDSSARSLVQTVKLMSEIKVVRRWKHLRKEFSTVAEAPTIRPAEVRVIALGASTGGPIALRAILAALPGDFPVPVLLVQHIVAGFTPGFVEWLAGFCSLPVKVAEDDEIALPGHIYVAPDGGQMGITSSNYIRIINNGLQPTVAHLFRSVAESYHKNAIGVLLTGMGSDGARELKLMKESQAITIAQDRESSLVHGMPGEAIKLNAATYVLPLSRIGPALVSLAAGHL